MKGEREREREGGDEEENDKEERVEHHRSCYVRHEK